MGRAVWADVRRRLKAHDLPLCAAGVSFYSVVAALPLLLVAVWLTGVLTDPAQLRTQLDTAASELPAPLDEGLSWLAETGTRLPSLAALAALVPAGLYGEGLVRSFARLSPDTVKTRALRGRLVTLALVATSPALVLVGAIAATTLPDRPRILSVYLTFVVTWLVVSAVLAVVYRFLTPASPGPWSLAWASLGAGSFVAGFGLGYVVFLDLGVPVGAAYGGALTLALAAIGFLWLQGLHLFALVGYAVALSLDARRG